MKYKGKTIQGPNKRLVPILREDMEIVFVIQSVVDLSPFYAICPAPKAPVMILPGNRRRENFDDPGYKQLVNDWASKKTQYILYHSFDATPDLVFETVDPNRPESWENWSTELQNSGFTELELQRILNAIQEVNSLNDILLEEAKQRFLTSQGEDKEKSNSPTEGQLSTPSGELVNVPVSASPAVKV